MLPYLHAPGAVRLACAYSGIAVPGTKRVLITLAEVLVPDARKA